VAQAVTAAPPDRALCGSSASTVIGVKLAGELALAEGELALAEGEPAAGRAVLTLGDAEAADPVPRCGLTSGGTATVATTMPDASAVSPSH
jgi:hypothetical protein